MANAMSTERLIETFERISNWGRWGAEDQRGALNFITNEKRAAAAHLIQSGETVSMALALASEPAVDNPRPLAHFMIQAGHDSSRNRLGYTADYFAIAPHGFATTHLDALCHILFRGKMYNGFDATEVGSSGARKCGIEVAREGIVGRGVLLDIPLARGISWLEPGEAISPADLDAAERAQGVTVEEGDLLLVRTGRVARRMSVGPWDPWRQGMAGLEASCLPWLHQRRIAVLGSDGASDVMPSGQEKVLLPIHVGALAFMGIHLIDNADLEAVAATCARTGRYQFALCLAPLNLEGGTASPVNPIGLF